jgi:hypothetical protein
LARSRKSAVPCNGGDGTAVGSSGGAIEADEVVAGSRRAASDHYILGKVRRVVARVGRRGRDPLAGCVAGRLRRFGFHGDIGPLHSGTTLA